MPLSGTGSAELKLQRAEAHLDAIEKAGGEPDGSSARIVHQPDGDSTVDLSGDVPNPMISVIAGEVVYQIKSALDHLAFNLVKRYSTQIQLPLNWERRCEFPILLDAPTNGNPPVPVQLPLEYNYFSRTLPGIPVDAFTFIEAIQPYHARNTGNILRTIANLANIDKHRHLHIINPQAHFVAKLISPNPIGNRLSVRRVEHGAKIDPAFPNDWTKREGAVYRERFTSPFVSFDESVLDSDTARLPICQVLQLCVDEVRGFIIPAFDKFFDSI